MNRFIKYIFGVKPEAGIYYADGHKRVITTEDIGNKKVRIRYSYLSDTILTFREFHAIYSTVNHCEFE